MRRRREASPSRRFPLHHLGRSCHRRPVEQDRQRGADHGVDGEEHEVPAALARLPPLLPSLLLFGEEAAASAAAAASCSRARCCGRCDRKREAREVSRARAHKLLRDVEEEHPLFSPGVLPGPAQEEGREDDGGERELGRGRAGTGEEFAGSDGIVAHRFVFLFSTFTFALSSRRLQSSPSSGRQQGDGGGLFRKRSNSARGEVEGARERLPREREED